MPFEVGKRVVAESESTDRRPRSGVVEEVLRGDPSPRYRIRWDDGHESDEQSSVLASVGDEKAVGTTQPGRDELALYYRDEDGHIHALE